MTRRTWSFVALALALFLPLGAVAVLEAVHHARYGDFFAYGAHLDVIRGNSDIGSNDTYFARLSNFSPTSLDIEGCVFASDVEGVPNSVLYRWDVQKRDKKDRRWMSLRGADTWMPGPFDGSWREEPCLPTLTSLKPLRSSVVAWVYKDWVTTGEPVRMAIHTRATKPPEDQRILYTKVFRVER